MCFQLGEESSLWLQNTGFFCKFTGAKAMLDALKSKNKTGGIKQSLKAVEADSAKLLFIARDADEKVVSNLRKLAESKSVEIIYVDSMKTLGKACGIEVGASAACLLK